jgi:hypothetical protein
MKRRLDSLMLGGALALGGIVSRRVGDVDRRVDELSDELAEAKNTPPPAPAPSIPGMPLPTGYGLQVRGPVGESIVLPVCLPPGFELDSMMLSPEFLPRVEHTGPQRRATDGRPPSLVATPRPAQHAPEPGARQGAGRLDGVLQLVFGSDQSYTSSIEHSEDGAPTGVPAAAPGAAVEEHTHR